MSEQVLAATVDAQRISAALVSLDGSIATRKAEPAVDASPEKLFSQLGRLVAAVVGKPHAKSASAAAISVAGAILRAADPAASIAWVEKLRKELRIPLRIEAEHIAAVIGECWMGAAQGTSDAVVLRVGNDICAGVLSGGRVLRGAHQRAGAAGWMAVSEADGFEVRKFGGLEAFASGPGIVRAAKNAIEAGFGGSLADYDPTLFTAEDIAELAKRGDVTARQIFRRAGKQLGLAVANLIGLFDPEVVVVSGSLTAASDLFWPDLLEIAALRSPPESRQVRICLSELQDDAVLLGAARLAAGALALPALRKEQGTRRKARRSRA